MSNKIEHIGIAVRNLAAASHVFEKLLGEKPYKTEAVQHEGVTTLFFQAGETKIELIESSVPGSAIEKFIAKKGEGIHHIALEVDDIYSEMERLKKEGFAFINEKPFQGADKKLVCFIHPKSAGEVLVELSQDAGLSSQTDSHS